MQVINTRKGGDFEIVSEITSNSNIVYSSVDWGKITGNIANQTDLQSALNSKADIFSLAQVATTGLYSDLETKPTFPMKASQLINNSNFVAKSSLANVATSGDYNDLINKPTLTDLSGTLSLTKGGTGGTTAVQARTNLDVMKEYVLTDQGVSSGSIVTLKDSIMNYKKIGIYTTFPWYPYTTGYQEFCIVPECTVYIITACDLALSEESGTLPYLRFFTGRMRFEGTSLDFEEAKTFHVTVYSTLIYTNELLNIRKIVGFKY